jgi:hypothetical protein
MIAVPYDIFRRDLLGTPVWMEAEQDIETAKLRIMEMAAARMVNTLFSPRKPKKS